MQSKHDQNSLQELNNQISDINAIDESGMTLLLEAIYEKDLDTVRDLLAKGANPNLPGSNAFPPLVAATALNSEEIVALLLSHPNIDVNQHQGQLKTALYVAAAKGYKTVMEQLLLFNTLQSIEVNINGSKHSPLFIAIYNKHEELALLLMERFPESINISTEKGYTPLHLAAQRGDLEIITKLLKAGANQPGQPNTHTPLTFALSNNHEEIACLLIQKFSEWVNLPDENENSPLLIAVANGLCNAAIQLIENKAELNWSGHTLLSVAIELRKSINNIEFISSLISRYPKLVNQPNEKGVYPLHLAAQEGQDDVVEQLLTHGADPFVKCETTPLIPAIFNKHKHVIDLLIQRYPLLANQPREMDGLTPLLFAVQEGNIDLVKQLIAAGADPLMKAEETPLTFAVALKNTDLALLLIRQFPLLVNLPNENGFYPLEIAVQEGLTNVVIELLSKKENIPKGERNIICIAILKHHEALASLLIETFPELVHQPTKEGYYPLHAVAQEGFINIFKELLRCGANIHATKNIKNDHHTALCSAAQKGHIEIVKLLLTYRHTEEYLTHLLNETTSCWIKEKDTKIRLNIYQCTELIKAKLGNNLEEKVLTLDDYSSFTWEECFEKLFGQKPEEEHKAPKDKDAAIRYAITSIYDFMLHPKKCLPYLRFLSEELGRQWKSEHDGKEFPTFDDNIIKLWAHQGNLWPIPKERYHAIKKNSLLDRLLLTKFKQYGMGETQTKWTGFVPKKTTKELLYNNTFFNENRSSINGLTHGNMHNLQRVVMLFAMEKGTIPLSYQQEDGTLGMIEPKEVFSALMRNDISLKKAPHLPLWETVLDTKLDSLTCRFTYPYDLHCMILTNEALAGTLQDYMRVSFCTHFNTMREVFNAKCETQYSNTSLCDELKKLKFEIFIHQFEETIKAETEKAQKDNLKIESDGDKWAIRYKNYKPLEYVGDFGDAIRDLCSRIDEEKREQSMARRVQG